jgi:hypothetical protein
MTAPNHDLDEDDKDKQTAEEQESHNRPVRLEGRDSEDDRRWEEGPAISNAPTTLATRHVPDLP